MNQVANCHFVWLGSVIAALPLSISLGFFWQSKIWSIKPQVAVGLMSLMSSWSEIATSYCSVILPYFWGVACHTYMRFISLIIHTSSLKMNTWTGSLWRSGTEEFKQYSLFRQKQWLLVVSLLSDVVEYMLYLLILPEYSVKTTSELIG